MVRCSISGCNRWQEKAKLCPDHYNQAYRAKHRKRILKQGKRYYKAHQAQYKTWSRTWHAAHPEQRSVWAHYGYIAARPSYNGMPFFRGWDPKHGGSFKAGAQWIIANIGSRPNTGYDLHIVDRTLGFVPDNLQWIPRDKHRKEELINKLLLEVQNLKKELETWRQL